MNRSAWERAKSLLADAADLPAADRERFVADRCPDPELRREVLELLTSPAQLSGIVAGSALQPGARLGPYLIERLLGRGGMGEVYEARDTTLNRGVAIKVLPDPFAGDADRLRRFRQEAQLLAALNHPNIAHIHGFEDLAGVAALVMELVDGPTLGDRIAHRAVPQAEALRIAKQIADALEAAHAVGIVHRDLKPANIKVRANGTVKVLDFGLATATDPTSSSMADGMNSPTIMSPVTRMAMRWSRTSRAAASTLSSFTRLRLISRMSTDPDSGASTTSSHPERHIFFSRSRSNASLRVPDAVFQVMPRFRSIISSHSR